MSSLFAAVICFLVACQSLHLALTTPAKVWGYSTATILLLLSGTNLYFYMVIFHAHPIPRRGPCAADRRGKTALDPTAAS